MNGNNGNGSRQNGNNGRARANKMERAPTRHQPRRGVRNLANARAVAQAAPQVRVSGPVRTRKAPRKNAKPYARASNNVNVSNRSRGSLSLNELSFGNSSFTMNRFNPKRAAKAYAPKFAPSGFVPLNAHQSFQSQMNEAIARQAAANEQRLANITQHRRNGAKKAAVTRQAKKEAMLAAQAAAAAAMEEVREAEQVVVAQGQSAMGVSPNAERALANAQRAAENADRAFRRALANENNNNNGAASASSAASAASGNNLSSMFGRL